MEYKRDSGSGSQILVRFEAGEEIMSSLRALCEKEKIMSAHISAIGSARKAEIAHYDSKKKRFTPRKLAGMLEIVSLSGSISTLDGEVKPHLHIILSMHDYSCMGGHLNSAEVYPTCEMVITPLKTKIVRKFDKKTGLNLQHFK